jgi:protein-disulfide isomerase
MVAALSLACAIAIGQQVVSAGDGEKIKGLTIADLETSAPNRLGDSGAEIQVVEFFDLMCPHCKKTYLAAKKIMHDNPGRISWSFRHFPVNAGGVMFSKQAAVFAEIAADEGKFFPYVDAVFATDPREISTDLLLKMAVGVGIPRKMLQDRATDPKDAAILRVAADVAKSGELGLSLAPVIFIGKPGEQVKLYLSAGMVDALKEMGLKVELNNLESESDGHDH